MHDYDDEFDMMNDEDLNEMKNFNQKSLFCFILLLVGSLILNDGFRNLTLLRRINFVLPVLPVILPALCAATDTKKENNDLSKIY
jgi:hypothetical protein